MLWKTKDKRRPDPRYYRGHDLEVIHEVLKPKKGYCPACGAMWSAYPDHEELARKMHEETCPRLHRELIVVKGHDPHLTKYLKEGAL